MTAPERKTPPPIIWWVIWSTTIIGLTAMYLVLHPSMTQPPNGFLRFLPVAPVFLALLVRWVLLPRFSGAAAFPAFILGLALAESCGIFGILLVPSLKQAYFALSLVGLVQFVPLFASRETP